MDLSSVVRKRLVTVNLGRFNPNALAFRAEEDTTEIPFLVVYDCKVPFSMTLDTR